MEMVVVGIALAGAEEIASSADERQLVCGAPRQPFLDVVGLLSVETVQVRIVVQHRFVVRQSLRLLHQLEGDLFRCMCFGQIDGIDHRVLETRLGVPFLRVEGEADTVAPLMAEGVISCVCVGCPGFKVLAADDVDNPTHGIRAVEGRRGAFHDLDTSDVIEVQTIVVRVVHGLSRQTLTVDEKEHGITTKTAHVERGLLTHGEAELQSWQLLNQHVLNIGGIDDLDVTERDQTGDNRGVLQGLRRMRCRDHDGVQLY